MIETLFLPVTCTVARLTIKPDRNYKGKQRLISQTLTKLHLKLCSIVPEIINFQHNQLTKYLSNIYFASLLFIDSYSWIYINLALCYIFYNKTIVQIQNALAP